MTRIKREKALGVPMDEQEMAMLEALARAEGMTKSGFIRYIIKKLTKDGYVTIQEWRAK